MSGNPPSPTQVMAAVALMVSEVVLLWLSGDWAVSLVTMISESCLVNTDVLLFFITDACPFSEKTMNFESQRDLSWNTDSSTD